MSRNIGVIGLGAMGYGVAQSLLRAGFNVHACDLRDEVLRRFADAGGTPCASPAELGERCDVVITLVVNAAQTEAVLFGEQGAASKMAAGKLVIASATVPPGFAEALGKRLGERGLLMLDAPVSGGAARAASGEMTMMTSGPPRPTPWPRTCWPRWPARSIAWATRMARARRSRSSTSCWPACISPPQPKRWPWACAKA
jgi:3-hydroxyisobutyrate dehydrogenase